MKHLALIVSLYILSLSAVPAVQLLKDKLTSQCGQSCSKDSKSAKDSDGCDKRECSFFSCCYKSVYFFTETKYTFHYFPYVKLTNNFGFTEMITSFNLFDIWHPPKLV